MYEIWAKIKFMIIDIMCLILLIKILMFSKLSDQKDLLHFWSIEYYIIEIITIITLHSRPLIKSCSNAA